MNKYIRIMRIDHWIKQTFIIPGIVMGIVLLDAPVDSSMLFRILIGFACSCAVASSNYVINEWLDAEFDKYHPFKKHRSVVENNMNKYIVFTMYFSLSVIGILPGILISFPFFLMLLWLWIMGILYNVKPFRTKDIAYLDVLTESLNNAIRLLLGWFIVTDSFVPPVSIVLGYWLTGAFLMSTKRFSEYRMIGDKSVAEKYRKSFRYYSQTSLLISSVFYGMLTVLFIGIFLIKYRIELILFMPFFIGLFCYYLAISFKKDSAVQSPEKLYREKGLMIYLGGLLILFIILMKVDIPLLGIFTREELLKIW